MKAVVLGDGPVEVGGRREVQIAPLVLDRPLADERVTGVFEHDLGNSAGLVED